MKTEPGGRAHLSPEVRDALYLLNLIRIYAENTVDVSLEKNDESQIKESIRRTIANIEADLKQIKENLLPDIFNA